MMNDTLKRHFEEFYQSADPYQTTVRFFERRRLENSFGLLPPDRHFRLAVDLGCGEGEFTRLLVSRAESVTGIDFVPAAIQRARAKYGHLAKFEVSTMDVFLAHNGPFDLITCVVALEYAENKPQALHQIANALRLDGLFLLVGTLSKKTGYYDLHEWVNWVTPRFDILKTEVISPAFRGHRIFHHPLFVLKRPFYAGATLLAKASPQRFCRHVGFLCKLKED